MTSKNLTPLTTSLCAVLLLLCFSGSSTAQQNQIRAKRVVSVTKTVVNVKTLAASSAVTATATATSTSGKGKKSANVVPSSEFRTIPAPRSIPEVETPGESLTVNQFSTLDIGGPLVPSPGPAQNFQGAVDEAVGGGP